MPNQINLHSCSGIRHAVCLPPPPAERNARRAPERFLEPSNLMTIAAGFLCSDGFVLAADTQHSGVNKRYAPKIWMARKGDVLIAMAGSGLSVALSRAEEDIRARLLPTMKMREVRDMVDGVLYALQHKYQPPYPGSQNPPPITVLVGVRIGGACRLYESDGSAILGPVQKNRSCIGWGSSLGLFFADSLFRKGMTLAWAEIIAAHLISQSKKYADGCGGKTHMLRVPQSGKPTRLHQSRITQLEGYLATVQEALRDVLPSPGISDETVARRVEILTAAILKARTAAAVKIGIPSGNISVVGEWISPFVNDLNSGSDIPLVLKQAISKQVKG